MFTAYFSLAVFLLLVIIASLVGAGFEAGEWFHVTIDSAVLDATILVVRPGLGAGLYSDGAGGLESLADRSLFTHPGLDLVGASAAVKCRLAGLDFWFAPAGLGAAIARPHDWHRRYFASGRSAVCPGRPLC